KIAKYIKEFNPDVAILRERSMYTICIYVICKHYHIPTILYNQSPVWDRPERMDLAHKIVWKLTPEYRITPVKLTERALRGLIGKEITEDGIVGKDIAGDSIVRDDIVKNDNAYWVPFVMEPQVPPEEKAYFAENRINIFCIGKYQERKNHQMMIEAVEELLPRYDLQLTIAGEISNSFHEEYYSKVSGYVKEHGLEDRVTFLSNLKKEDVAKEYRKADVYVLPSTGEPAAVTPLEAMAYSVPAICSTGNGTADYIDHGRTGYIFRDNDKKDLKDKLEKIICDRENLVRMGAAAYHHVKENFQFSNYYEQIEQILHEMKRRPESREKMKEK
ncbi:MAG: glycosyltransferase family 4 protein, partial [Lachnospiraceae bacterium]|nr:glycosyltransferase family 4 protein [Lachnospiraceae bacterium]